MTRMTRALTESAVVLTVGFAVVAILLFAFAQSAQAQTELTAQASLEGTSHVLIADTGVSVVSSAYTTTDATAIEEKQKAAESSEVYEQPHHTDTANVTVATEAEADIHTEKAEKKAGWHFWLQAFLSLFSGAKTA